MASPQEELIYLQSLRARLLAYKDHYKPEGPLWESIVRIDLPRIKGMIIERTPVPNCQCIKSPGDTCHCPGSDD